jgi:hypothetical protein
MGLLTAFPDFTQFYLTRVAPAGRLRDCDVEGRSQPPEYGGAMEVVDLPSAAVSKSINHRINLRWGRAACQ